MSHQFDSGAFYQEGAWHGLGTIVTEKLNTSEFMKAAGMDWLVNEHPVHNPDGTLIPGWKSLRRSDSNELLHVCRTSWTPVQNHEAFAWFDPFIQDGDLELNTAVALAGGRKIALTAEFTTPYRATVVKDDDVELKLLLFNSHDGSLSVGIKFTPIRVVCNNTLNMALNYRGKIQAENRTVTLKHTSGVKQSLDRIRDSIDLAKRCFTTTTLQSYQALASVDLNTQQWRRYLEDLYQIPDATKSRHYDKLTGLFESGVGQDLPGVRGTAWAAYNAITEYAKTQKVESQLFGTYAERTKQALEVALTLA